MKLVPPVIAVAGCLLVVLDFAASEIAIEKGGPEDVALIRVRRRTDAESKRAAPTDPNNPPKFNSLTNELKWKFNKARNDLKAAKQFVELAEKEAETRHRGTTEEQAVRDIISKTEVVLVHAGEKLGLDYVHYKRSVEEEDEPE